MTAWPVTSVGREPCSQTHAYSSSYQWNRYKFPGRAFVHRLGAGLRIDSLVPTLHHLPPPCFHCWANGSAIFLVGTGWCCMWPIRRRREIYRDFLADQFIGQGVAGFKLDDVDGSPKTSEAYRNLMFPDFAFFPSGARMASIFTRWAGSACRQWLCLPQNRRTFGLVRADQAWSSPLSVAVYSDEYNFSD